MTQRKHSESDHTKAQRPAPFDDHTSFRPTTFISTHLFANANGGQHGQGDPPKVNVVEDGKVGTSSSAYPINDGAEIDVACELKGKLADAAPSSLKCNEAE